MYLPYVYFANPELSYIMYRILVLTSKHLVYLATFYFTLGSEPNARKEMVSEKSRAGGGSVPF